MKPFLTFPPTAKAQAFGCGMAVVLALSAPSAPGQSSPAPAAAPPQSSDAILARWMQTPAQELKAAAERGDAEAQFVFGLQQWREVRALSKEAGRWQFAAVSNGENLTPQEEAESNAKWKDKPERELRQAAERGERGAQWFLGHQIQSQANAQAPAAVGWLQKAGEQSFVAAELELGGLYYKGGAAGYDPKKARHWLGRAAAHGSEAAQHRLARMLLEDGEDVPEAIKLLRSAADQGCPLAQFDLAQQYSCGNGDPRHGGETPLSLLRKAATNGLPEACLGIAGRYQAGVGVSRDLVRAINWYRRAYDAAGRYVRNDQTEHFMILSKQNDNDRVQEAVATLFEPVNEDGSLDPRKPIADPDLVAVLQIETKADRRHDPAAQARLAQLFEDGVLTQRDYAQAFLWYSIAAREAAPTAASRRDALKPRLSAAELGEVEGWLKTYDESLRRNK
jgi:TPR repeat protein